MAVYFFQVGEEGPIKIGYAGRSVLARLKECQVGIPYELRVRGVIAKGDRSLEQQLHGKFERHWIRGEWFIPHDDLLAYVKRHAKPFRPAKKKRADPSLSLNLIMLSLPTAVPGDHRPDPMMDALRVLGSMPMESFHQFQASHSALLSSYGFGVPAPEPIPVETP